MPIKALKRFSGIDVKIRNSLVKLYDFTSYHEYNM
jgi:hypothetical protein